MSLLRRSAFLLFLPIAAAFHCSKANKNNTDPGAAALKDSVIASGLFHPWEILWGPDNHIWMTERDGQLSRLNPATGAVIPLFSITEVLANGEGGLLGMVLHPNFTTTPHVFVVYNYSNAGGNYREKIVRYTYNGTTLTSPLTIMENIAAAGIHNGSRLLISSDLKLYVTTGDAATPSSAQNISSPNGKVLRLNLDGTIPADNPVAGNPYWSLGHRNAQGMVFANGKLFVSEHGPNNDDEINLVEKGRNYGWPTVEGFCNESGEQSFCTSANVREPLKAWTPTVAACGLDYYNHDLIPQWKNSLLMVTLKDATLHQLKLDNNQTTITGSNEYFSSKYGRLRDICIAPNGKVYVSTSNGSNDKIVQIR